MNNIATIAFNNDGHSLWYISDEGQTYTTIRHIYDSDKEDTINNAECDEYISTITLGGKKYKIKAEVVEVFPTICKKCGGSFELHHGEGKCPYCGTHYTTMYKVVEG